MTPTYNRASSEGKEPHVSDQEQREDQPAEEEIEDLEVSEEQTDDVTGGAGRRHRDKRFHPGGKK
jgi:hypothetical protein